LVHAKAPRKKKLTTNSTNNTKALLHAAMRERREAPLLHAFRARPIAYRAKLFVYFVLFVV
jgi:hypothetical protein